jgi:hypothetical protein
LGERLTAPTYYLEPLNAQVRVSCPAVSLKREKILVRRQRGGSGGGSVNQPHSASGGKPFPVFAEVYLSAED